MTTRTPMTRAALLKFNPRWDSVDIAVIEEDIERFGGVSFEHVQRGWNSAVQVRDAAGELLMEVARGTVYYAGQRTRPGSVERASAGTGHVYYLSTRGNGGGRVEQQPDHGPRCTTCWLHHPEGGCDR